MSDVAVTELVAESDGANTAQLVDSFVAVMRWAFKKQSSYLIGRFPSEYFIPDIVNLPRS